MTEPEKAAYILGLKTAIEQIESEAVWSGMEWSGRSRFWSAAQDALQKSIELIKNEIAMTSGTRETIAVSQPSIVITCISCGWESNALPSKEASQSFAEHLKTHAS